MKRTPVRKKHPGIRRGPAEIPPEKWRNPKYLRFLKAGHCSVCWRNELPGDNPTYGDSSFVCIIDPCHGPVNGKGSKGPDSEAVPMCRVHHEQQHLWGWPRFEKYHGFSRSGEAAKWWAAFEKLAGR